MKFRNEQAGMEIGICHISNSSDFEKGYWLYVQVGGVRMMVALHRKYGFGYERCARIYQQIEATALEYRNDPKRIRKACLELTGIDVADVVTKKGDQDEKNSDAADDNVHHAGADRRARRRYSTRSHHA